MSFRQDELTGHNWPSGSVSVGIPVRPPALEKNHESISYERVCIKF